MNGAQIGAQDSNEKTPLNLALCELGTLETADVLIQNNAYVTPEDQVAYDKKKEALEKANLMTKVNHQTIKTADYKDSYDLNSSNSTVLSSCLKRKLSDVNASNFTETTKSYKSWFRKQSKCEKPSKIVVNKPPDESTTQMNRVQQSIYETSLNYYSICDEDTNMMMMSQYNCTPKNSTNPNVFLSNSNQLNLSKYEERNSSNEPFDRNGQYANVNYAFQHHLLHYQENKTKSAPLTYSQQTSQQNQRNSIGTNLYFNSGSTETYEAYI